MLNLHQKNKIKNKQKKSKFFPISLSKNTEISPEKRWYLKSFSKGRYEVPMRHN
jgi:hypothetical protein